MNIHQWLKQLTMAERAKLADQAGYSAGTISFIAASEGKISAEGAQLMYESEFNRRPSKKGGMLTKDALDEHIAKIRDLAMEQARAKIRA